MTYSLKDEPVLVTGGAGFIGSYLSRRLINEGAPVFVLARKASSLDLISDIRSKLEVCYSEITNPNSLLKIVSKIKPKIIFHLAAHINVGSGFELVKPLIDVNLFGTINILRAAGEAGNVRKFIFFGTSDVYGNMTPPFSENSPVSPISTYAASKASAELFCKYMATKYSIPWVILRPFIIYGGGQTPHMFIPQLIKSALKGNDFLMTGGEQTRDFLYIDDFVDACIKASLCSDANGEIINVASGKEVTLAEVVEKVTLMLDHPIKIHLGALPYRENERWRIRADIKKARKLLDWKPETGLSDGLKKTFRWYKNSKERFQ